MASSDEQAATWIAEHEEYISYVASRYGGDRDEAAQNARVCVMLALRKGLPEGAVAERYLRGVVFRAVKQVAIGQRPALKEAPTPGHMEVMSQGRSISLWMSTPGEEPEMIDLPPAEDRELADVESEMQLLWMLDGLPRELQWIVYHRAHGVPAADLAAELGVSQGSLTTRWNKALELLRQRLGVTQQDRPAGVPRGISWNRGRKHWEVKMSHNGRRYSGGTAHTVEAAVVKLDALRERVLGEAA